MTTTKTTEFKFATDSETGTISAGNFVAACGQLDQMLTDEAVEAGAWGWVEDVDGFRYRVGQSR